MNPRILVVPDCVSSRGEEALEFCRAYGLVLDDWQELCLRESLGVNAGGRWAAEEVGVTVARQQGKTSLSVARELCGAFLFGEQLIVHSAHERPASFEAFLMLAAIIESSEELSRKVQAVRRATGGEGIDLVGGGRIRYRTRTKQSGRGFACNCLVLDEAHTLAEASMAALAPMLQTKIGQLWYLGTAVDKSVHEHGFVFSQVRQRARSGEAARLFYAEWSAAPPVDADGREVGPDELDDEFLDDEVNIRAANPAIASGRVSIASIALARRVLSKRAYAVEILSVGDHPTGAAAEQGPISLELWQSLLDEGSVPLEPLTIAVDINPAGRASFSAAGFREDGSVHVGCVASDLQVEGAGQDTKGGLYERLRRFGRDHSFDRVLVDERLLRRPVQDAIEDATYETIEAVTTADYAKSCATFLALANEGRLRHVGSSRLTDSLKGAHARVYVDSFLWSRRLSAGDASPVISATLAAGGLVNDRMAAGAVGPRIFG